MHGEMDQIKRDTIMKEFRTGAIKIRTSSGWGLEKAKMAEEDWKIAAASCGEEIDRAYEASTINR